MGAEAARQDRLRAVAVPIERERFPEVREAAPQGQRQGSASRALLDRNPFRIQLVVVLQVGPPQSHLDRLSESVRQPERDPRAAVQTIEVVAPGFLRRILEAMHDPELEGVLAERIGGRQVDQDAVVKRPGRSHRRLGGLRRRPPAIGGKRLDPGADQGDLLRAQRIHRERHARTGVVTLLLREELEIEKTPLRRARGYPQQSRIGAGTDVDRRPVDLRDLEAQPRPRLGSEVTAGHGAARL